MRKLNINVSPRIASSAEHQYRQTATSFVIARQGGENPPDTGNTNP
jgi:hypothetical protein